LSFFTILVMAVALSMDAFTVALTRGMCAMRHTARDAIVTALYFGVAQGIMPVVGFYAGKVFGPYISGFDHWVILALMAVIGGKMIIDAIRKKPSAECCEYEKVTGGAVTGSKPGKERQNLRDKMLLPVLAVATSIDAMAAGIGIAFMAPSVFYPAAVIGIVTFFICLAGYVAGKKAAYIIGSKAEILGGAILIGIGLKTVVDHIWIL